jgi:hypothetical protein
LVIAAVDQGLEQLLRAALPLPPEIADVSFEPPDGTWGAQLSRITVNLFLFDIGRSPQPPRPPAERLREDGRIERRPPLPLIRLYYLVSAWAGSTRDEHQLLGDLMSCLLGYDALPAEYLPPGLPAAVQLGLADRDGRRPGELWGGLHGRLKPAFELEATVALDADWRLAPTAVTSVQGMVAPQPQGPPVGAQSSRSAYSTHSANGSPPPTTRRRSGGSVVTEGRPAGDP